MSDDTRHGGGGRSFGSDNDQTQENNSSVNNKNIVQSRGVSIRNLGSDITARIREQMVKQEMLTVPIREYRGDRYIGVSGTIESIDDLASNIDGGSGNELLRGLDINTTNSAQEQTLAQKIYFKTLGALKDKENEVYKGEQVLDNISLQFGESPVLNPPWQFNELDDLRSNPTFPHMGRVYLTHIYSNMPILVFQPGREKHNCNFLGFFGKGLSMDGKALNDYIRSGGDAGFLEGLRIGFTTVKNTILAGFELVGSFFGSNFFNASKIISFKPAMPLFRKMCNNLLKEVAVQMGLLAFSNQKNNATETAIEFDLEDDVPTPVDTSAFNDYKKELGETASKDLAKSSSEKDDNASYQGNFFMGAKSMLDDVVTWLGQKENAVMDKIDEAGNTYKGSMKRLDLLNMLNRSDYQSSDSFLNGALNDYQNAAYLPFMCSNAVTVSETFTNSTQNHPVIDQLNGMYSQGAQDKAFGGVGTAFMEGILNGVQPGNLFQNLEEVGNTFLKRVGSKVAGEALANASEIGMVINGDGKLLVPEMWAGSSFSRNYSVDFKFFSPSGATIPIFENTMIQSLILTTLAAPIQTGFNLYMSPFVCKVYSKGLFSVDFGIIESLTITRGEEKNDRSKFNYPRTIKVSVSIKDLSPTMMLSLGGQGWWKYRRANTGLTEYIATLTNMSISDRFDIGRRFQNYMSLLTTNFRDAFSLDNIGYNLSNAFFLKPFYGLAKFRINVDKVKPPNVYY